MTVDEQFDAWLSEPSFEILQQELKAEIYQRQCDTLESAPDWDMVMFNRGWCSALAYIANLREVRENLHKNEVGEFDAHGTAE